MLMKTLYLFGKQRESEMMKKVHDQKVKVASDLFDVMENEMMFDNKKCNCKGFCRIFHEKHNWKRSFSQDKMKQLRVLTKLYSCNYCDKTFVSADNRNLHVENVHKKIIVGEDGEVIVRNPSLISGGRLLELC